MNTMPASGEASPAILRIGALRAMLLASVAVVIAAAPFADGSVHVEDWRIFPSVIAPTLMMMLVFTLPLDITMSRIFMSDAVAAEHERLSFVIKLEIIALVLLVAAWTPFLLKYNIHNIQLFIKLN